MGRFTILLLTIFLSIGFSSCSLLDFLDNKKKDKEEKEYTQYLVVDTEGTTPFKYILFSELDATTTFFQCDEEDKIKQATLFHGDSILNIIMDDDGRIKSFSDGIATISIGYDENDRLIMSYVDEEESIIWDDLDIIHPDFNSSKSKGFDDFADWLEQTAFNQSLYNFSNEHAWWLGILSSGGVSSGFDIYNKNLNNLVWNYHAAGFSGLSKMNSTYTDILSMATTLIDSRLHAGPWGLLVNLLINYSSYVNLCEKIFDILIPIFEKQEEQDNIGSAAISTGIGDLKATLTWNFYADIDIHAYEPSGTHIYYSNMYGDTGYLDHDNTKGGPGSKENIFWSKPLPGNYDFYLDYYGPGDNGLSQSGICNVYIYYNKQGTPYSIPMSSGTKYVVTVRVPEGRSGNDPEITISEYDNVKENFVIPRSIKSKK